MGGILIHNGQMLSHVAANQNDEREAHDQPHRFDGGIEFVSA